MVIAAFAPAQQMAAANFALAMLGIFMIGLPALLITRGNKTEANRKFLTSVINPWNEDSQKLELASVLEISPVEEIVPGLELVTETGSISSDEIAEEQSADLLEYQECVETNTPTNPTSEELLAA